MINTRLVWFLKKNNILSKYQSGFRKGRTTTDQLMRLESFISDSFLKGNYVVSVFFDLEKAYDTVWKYGVIRDLHKVGLRGRMPMFIQNFLSNRVFRVRLGSIYSDMYEQEMGVPQGSILSVTLFILKINSIADVIPASFEKSLFVDDFSITCSCRNMASFIYLGFCVAFNTIQVISRWVVGRAEETSIYSSLGFCTVNCRPTASNYQLSHLRP